MLDCGHEPTPTEISPGYAKDQAGQTICFECCARRDRETMIQTGTSASLPLYYHGHKISNWPGTLTFTPIGSREGKHNIGRTRVDVWFVGPDGHVWHGVQIGQWNEILHAKRTKEVWSETRYKRGFGA